MWRKVICSKYRIEEKSLFWNWKGSKDDSFFVKSLASMLKEGSKIEKVIREGFRIVKGDGKRVDMW
jgi:hypothetical protein